MVPLFTGIFVSWFDLMEMFNLDSSWFWSNIVGRLLLGTVPGMDLLYRDGFGQGTGEHGMQEIIASLSPAGRSEEHTSELQSLMRISYAVFCLKKKNKNK